MITLQSRNLLLSRYCKIKALISSNEKFIFQVFGLKRYFLLLLHGLLEKYYSFSYRLKSNNSEKINKWHNFDLDYQSWFLSHAFDTIYSALHVSIHWFFKVYLLWLLRVWDSWKAQRQLFSTITYQHFGLQLYIKRYLQQRYSYFSFGNLVLIIWLQLA